MQNKIKVNGLYKNISLIFPLMYYCSMQLEKIKTQLHVSSLNLRILKHNRNIVSFQMTRHLYSSKIFERI